MRLTSVWLTGAWRLVRGKIPRLPNWAVQGQAVWERKRVATLKVCVGRGADGGELELMVKEGFPSHMKVCGDECTIIRLISSLIYCSRGYQRLHIRGRPED